ncbi:hypothetical protein PPSIR1_18817 [Plesiocystis pacifica SIR-1]|uniref:Uncharacterized protein n=1 Tax=Plesiocystis pacifica SIR-1 TaxID=391625 RepID=A6GBH9_9BACT|nr:hypothetical protein [Plesiocystis pacifica]EDM76783.1 hypothetical protein PPSIR1_18817 [Plesiocystis pacifica SIR-1]
MSDADDDPLADFNAAARRRKRLALAGLAALGAALLGLRTWWVATALPGLEDEAVDAATQAMDGLHTVPDDQRAALAALAFAELEEERLPLPMLEAFRAVAAVAPSQVSLVALEPFAHDADSLAAWSVVCDAGPEAITTYVANGDIDQLFADCSLGRWSLIDGHAARRVSGGRLVLAHAAWGWLVDHHSETELERRILRVFVQG